jgi:uncharacterized membrane protein YkvA (DUF1232 family)
MKTLVGSFYNWYSGSIRNPKYRLLMVLGTLFYLFSPIDFAPDFLPIIGMIDDGIVLTLLTTELSRLAIDYRNQRKGVKESNNAVVTIDNTEVSA